MKERSDQRNKSASECVVWLRERESTPSPSASSRFISFDTFTLLMKSELNPVSQHYRFKLSRDKSEAKSDAMNSVFVTLHQAKPLRERSAHTEYQRGTVDFAIY